MKKWVRWRHAALMLLKLLGLLVIALLIADLAMKYPSDAQAFQAWMYASRYGWLVWRVMLYLAIAWLVCKISRAPGFKPEYRTALLRISVISLLFIITCESTLLTGIGRGS